MFESLGLENTTPREASVLFALALGLLFGFLAERTGFCLRRSVVAGPERRAAAGVWATALAFAVLGTQIAVAGEYITFAEHRLLNADLPWLAIITGGVLFGAGMVLTRGCVSRLMVLGASGNLRALLVVTVFAVVAHATLKGILAPVRTTLGSVTASLGEYTSLSALPGGGLFWAAVIAAAALGLALRSGNRFATLAGAAVIGLLAVAGWVGTGFVLYDDFDPIAMESLSFTAPAADSLFFIVASSSIPAGFGAGLLGGVLGGALVASLLFRSFRWQSFEGPAQTGRYLAGAVLMGIGGVLAGGCTVGAGLTGVPTLGFAAILALAAIIIGARIADVVLNQVSGESGAQAATPNLQPAE